MARAPITSRHDRLLRDLRQAAENHRTAGLRDMAELLGEACGAVEELRSAQRASLEERFWARVQRGDGCWLWTGAKKDGYGQVYIGIGKRVLAPRVSWEIHHGPVPDGLFVLHRCDNPPCVNPGHLWLGTLEENNNDRHEKGRSRGGSRRGELSPHAKLSGAQVLQIRARRAGGARYCDLAREFGVKRETVRDIVERNTWRHL